MTGEEIDKVEKDFAKAAGSVHTETEERSSKKQKVDKGDSAEDEEQAKHERSEAEAKTFKQEVLSEIQEMMLSWYRD